MAVWSAKVSTVKFSLPTLTFITSFTFCIKLSSFALWQFSRLQFQQQVAVVCHLSLLVLKHSP